MEEQMMTGTISLPLPHSAPPAGPLSRGENNVDPGRDSTKVDRVRVLLWQLCFYLTFLLSA